MTLATKQRQDRWERITELAGLNSLKVAKAWSQTGAALEYRSLEYTPPLSELTVADDGEYAFDETNEE